MPGSAPALLVASYDVVMSKILNTTPGSTTLELEVTAVCGIGPSPELLRVTFDTPQIDYRNRTPQLLVDSIAIHVDNTPTMRERYRIGSKHVFLGTLEPA